MGAFYSWFWVENSFEVVKTFDTSIFCSHIRILCSGYKPGTCLGLRGDGIVDPIVPSLSSQPYGLGHKKRKSRYVSRSFPLLFFVLRSHAAPNRVYSLNRRKSVLTLTSKENPTNFSIFWIPLFKEITRQNFLFCLTPPPPLLLQYRRNGSDLTLS